LSLSHKNIRSNRNLVVVQKRHRAECSSSTTIVNQGSLVLAQSPFVSHHYSVSINLEVRVEKIKVKFILFVSIFLVDQIVVNSVASKMNWRRKKGKFSSWGSSKRISLFFVRYFVFGATVYASLRQISGDTCVNRMGQRVSTEKRTAM